jgi:tetratricopeptide (TPR) repeat protein
VAWVARLDDTVATFDRALAAEPTLMPLLAAESLALWHDARPKEAAVLLVRCLDLSPRAVYCLRQRAELLDKNGECAAAEADVRRLLVLQPSSRWARPMLAGLLAAQGAPVGGVREALGEDARAGTIDWWVIPTALVPMFEGDFADVERLAKEGIGRVSASAPENDHFLPTATLVSAYAEVNDPGSAGRVAADYLSRRVAWKDQAAVDGAVMIGAAARGGRLDRAEASRRLDETFHHLTEGGWDPSVAWAEVYASAAETRAEALAAVAKLDALRLAVPTGWGRAASSRTLFLAGRGDDARPGLEYLAGTCSYVLLNPRNWAHAHLYLGELDEQSGDKPSACAHYAKVLERWGHAKPRSVTADEARAHATKLGCTP